MNKLQTALLASTFLAIAASPALATGIGGGPPAPTISDFGFSSTTTSFSGNVASGYFTVSNNTTDWDVIGFSVGADNTARYIGGDTSRELWSASAISSQISYDDFFLSLGSGEGVYLNPLAPGQTDSGFFWSESFAPQIIFLDPPYFVDLFNPNNGDFLTLDGGLDTVATVPEPSTLSAFLVGLLGLVSYLGMARRRPSLLARRSVGR